ncbi:cyclic pyranopterin monophosphate synthase MoaC [Chloroflexota bacterium]
MKKNQLTHLDESGKAKMVDISMKNSTGRIAVAKGEIKMQSNTLSLIKAGSLDKGDVLTVAKIAGINAAKKTFDLIPLCHQISLTKLDLSFTFDEHLPGVIITAQAESVGRTGVEMEALVAVSIAALTIYDMAKAVEKTMSIQNIRLIEKRGGSSGDVFNKS